MKFLLVDDQPIITHALYGLLKDSFPDTTRIDSVADGLMMFDCLSRQSYDVLVLDPFFHCDLQGITLLRTILNQTSRLKVVVFSAHHSPCLVQRVLEQNACAFVCKTSSPNLIVGAVELLLAGGEFCDPAVDLARAREHPWHSLGYSERQVLLALAAGECLNAIAARNYRSYKTVAAHKYNALHKLGLDVGVDMASYLASQGLEYLLDDWISVDRLGTPH